MILPTNADLVKEKIKSAFANVHFPDDDSLLSPDSKDEEEIKDFKGKNWQNWEDVPKDIIDYNHSSLPFFSPSALIFLMPAYMMAGLNDTTTNTLLFTLFALTPNQNSGEPNPTEYFLSWTTQLTPDQRTSIVLFLEYIQEQINPEFASKALQSYWKEFS
jgi:hypothetical protein